MIHMTMIQVINQTLIDLMNKDENIARTRYR